MEDQVSSGTGAARSIPGCGHAPKPIINTPTIIHHSMVSDTSKRNVLLASALGSSFAPFMVSALIVALPTIGREFSADAPALGWVTNIFFIAAAVSLVPLGRIADMKGVKKVFTLGISVYLVSSVLCIIAPDITFLIVARFITGIGAGMIFGTSIALLSLVFPQSERGKAIGINVTAMSLGFLLGFFLGGFLTFYLGWRSIFIILIPLELGVISLVLSRIKGECEITRRGGLDVPGMLLYGFTVFFVMTGFSILPSLPGGILIGAGVICLVLFSFQERRTTVPLINISMFRENRIFSAANLTVLLFNISNFAVIFLLSLYLQDVRGFDARYAGIFLLTPVIFMALLSTYAGKLSDRKDPRLVIGVGLVSASLSLVILAGIGSGTSLSLIIAALALSGTGIALCQSPLVRTSISSVPKEMYGLASGMIETMRLMGMTISIAISIIIFSTVIGTTRITASTGPSFIASLQLIFRILLVISLSALLVALLLKRPAPQDESVTP